jgi:hypothetical protein
MEGRNSGSITADGERMTAGHTGTGGADTAGEHGHPGTPSLYAEMLPLVEAGATVEQAARRFGADADELDEIAEGFARWREGESVHLTADLGSELAAAHVRIAALESENRALRRRMADLRGLIRRAGDILDG